jgi:hypothetical protein
VDGLASRSAAPRPCDRTDSIVLPRALRMQHALPRGEACAPRDSIDAFVTARAGILRTML